MISGVASPQTWVIPVATVLITVLLHTHERLDWQWLFMLLLPPMCVRRTRDPDPLPGMSEGEC